MIGAWGLYGKEKEKRDRWEKSCMVKIKANGRSYEGFFAGADTRDMAMHHTKYIVAFFRAHVKGADEISVGFFLQKCFRPKNICGIRQIPLPASRCIRLHR